jgi:hypothetical protein
MINSGGFDISPSLKEFVASIEQGSGCEIEFRRYTLSERRRMPLTSKYAAAALDPVKDRAMVVLPAQVIDARAVVHELLHLTRWLVHGVPMIAAHPDGALAGKEGYFRVDNDLEHLTIVPAEYEMVGDNGFWRSELLNALKRWRRGGNVAVDLLLTSALTRKLAPGSEAEALCNMHLKTENLTEKANNFCEAIFSTDDKLSQCGIVIAHLGLNPRDWQLQQYNKATRQYLAAPVPF